MLGKGVISSILMLLAFMSAAPAFANCEANFSRQGVFPQAQSFSSRIDIPGLTPDIAFSQMRALFEENRMLVLSEDKARGTLRAELPPTAFFPRQMLDVVFRQNGAFGSVTLTNMIKPDVIANTGAMRARICGMLNRLTDPYGRTERALYANVPTAQPVISQVAIPAMARATPPKLVLVPSVSIELAPAPAAIPVTPQIEARQLALQVATVRNNPARIETQFIGREYRLSGKVIGIVENYRGYAVKFEGIPITAMDGGQQTETMLQLVCQVPKGKAAAAASLNPGQRGSLKGRFFRVENHSSLPVIALEDCGS